MSTFSGVAYAGEAFVGAPAAPAPAGVNTIEFLLYDAINANFLGLLDATSGRKWHDPHNDAGAGEFDIHSDHPLALSQLTDANGDAVYDNVVRCRLNGTVRYAFIIKENKKSTAKADEEVGRLLHIAGPGTLAYFRESVVYPERGIGRISPDNRLFNWTAFSFNDTSWPAASEKATYGTPIPGSTWNGLNGLLPPDFPDLTAKWIWGSSGTATSDAPPGDAYFRKKFTLTSTQSVKAAFTGDNGMDLFIDNAPVTSKQGHNSAWTQAAALDLLLDQGEHLIAVKVHNLTNEEASVPPGTVFLNLAGLLFSLHYNAFGGAPGKGDFGAMIMHTDSSWKVLQYPPGGPPGMTPGEVLRVLFTEAQARGAMPGVTWTFTDANDSNGSPWAVTPDFGVQVGTTYEAMLRQLAEVACDLHMDPNSMRIDVFNQRGTARSATLTIAGNITDLEHEGTGDVINAAILRHSTGWRESLLASSITAHGRHEGFLSLGTAPSTEQGDLAAQSLFLETGNPRDAIVVTHEGAPASGAAPYADYDVADTITAPARDGQAKTQSVKAITVAEDAEGNPIFTPELQALSDAFDARLQRWLKRMSAGTVSGQSESASPFMPSSSQKEKVPAPEALSKGTGIRSATVVVAASNSLHPDAASADFLCTGTNDHLVINQALDSLPNGNGAGGANPENWKGGRVLLMEGTYHIGGEIKFTGTGKLENFEIVGQGESTLLLLSQSFTGTVIKASSNNSVNVRSLRIHGNGFTVTNGIVVSGDSFAMNYVQDVHIQDITVTGAAIVTSSFNSTMIERCILDSWATGTITGAGVALNQGSDHVRNCVIQASTLAITGNVSGHGFITGNYLRGDAGGIADAHALVVIGNRIQSKTGPAIAAGVLNAGSQLTMIIGNWINLLTGSGAGCHAISLLGGWGTCADNHIWGFNSTSFDGINISGDEWAVLNNVIGPLTTGNQQPRTGIRLETTADKNIVIGNVLRNLTTALNDLGTNTKLVYTGGASGNNVVL